ncbi:hydrogenase-4 component F [Breznakibacter xylanolyticus]|uniref:Hydrogenase-4 component F n=1 Tax=Breznakibacter xylanolyticus TaxID=990 RepID=A0A2W7Q6C0_9BACT|nr:proton-conducting transporter membrane subunit [Breznakibacter xylanolyticus]PZX17289.1 hydrogenase-4 component F [Breznakibacter xylanolyticus]
MIGIYLILAFAIALGLYFNRNERVTIGLLLTFVALQTGLTVHAALNHHQHELGYFTYDSLGLLLLVVLSVLTIPALLHSHIYLNEQPAPPQARSIYYASMVLLITAIGAGYLANHIAVTWIFTELTTLSASALIYHHRNKLALEGTWKYVFVCAISITFVFIGILFLSLSMNHAHAEDMSFGNLIRHSHELNPFWLRLAFLFIFTGFTAKMGLVPMFTAGVDAKDKAPAPAGALLSSALMNLGFIGIFRTYTIIANTELKTWAAMVMGISALLSLLVATVYMIKVKNIKRMMAYSSIEHMGLVMLAMAAGGVGYYAAILHIVLHSLVKPSLFFQFTQLYRVFKSKSIYQTGNYFRYNPTGAMVLLLGFISATAMPPSGLFVSEFLIFKSLVQGGHFIVLGLVLLLLTIIIWAFGKNIFKILFIPPVGFNDAHVPSISPRESLSQFILLASAIYLGLNPPAVLVNLINDCLSNLPV